MIFDGHTDIWTDVTIRRLSGEKDVFRRRHLPKWQKGGLKGGIFVVWIDPPYDREPKKRVRQILGCLREELAEASDILRLITRKEDFLLDDGKIHAVLGMEGLSHVDEETGLEVIDEYHALGLRHASMTWNEQNALATGVRGEEDRGLTKLGLQALDKLERLGILVDVSHLNEKSFWDMAKAATRPLMASHSNAKAVFDHPRNLTDDQIREIGRNGGIIGLNAYNEFVDAPEGKRTAEGLALHGAHIAELIGPEHLVFGFDYCDFLEDDALSSFASEDIHVENYSSSLTDLANASETQNILQALLKVGFSEREVQRIKSENYRDFIGRMWK